MNDLFGFVCAGLLLYLLFKLDEAGVIDVPWLPW